MARLEAKAMLLGIWSNIEELESKISLEELQAILTAASDSQWDNWKFQASLKGVDLGDKETESAEERFEKVRRSAEAKMNGLSEEAVEMAEIGLDFEEG